MQSNAFGSAATGLGDAQVAQLLIVAALAPAAFREYALHRGSLDRVGAKLWQGLTKRRVAGGDIARPLVVRVGHIAKLLRSSGLKTQAYFVQALPELWMAAGGDSGPMHALELTGVPPELDVAWLMRTFSELRRVDSIVFRKEKNLGGMWAWPLRIHAADAALGRELADGRYNFLYGVVKGRAEYPVDLAIVSGSIDDALRSRPRAAHAVLVLEDADSALRPGNIERLQELRKHYFAGFAGICTVPSEERPSWVQALIRELSHNKSLPACLFEIRDTNARSYEGGPVSQNLPIPLLMGDARFLRGHDLASAADRLADAIKLIDQLPGRRGLGSLAKVGRELKQGVRYFSWAQEIGDARRVTDIASAVQKKVGRAQLEIALEQAGMPAPKQRAPKSPPPPVASKAAPYALDPRLMEMLGSVRRPEMSRRAKRASPPKRAPAASAIDVDVEPSQPRSVQMQVFNEPSGTLPDKPVKKLVADATYRLQVHIGPPAGADFTQAPEQLDESTLPQSEAGNELTIVYCPLSKVKEVDGDLAIPAPAQATILLPRTGASNVAEFKIQVGPDVSAFSSRIIVSFENRVLQTLLLRIDGRGRLKLSKENMYAPLLDPRPSTAPAEAAFVIHDAPAGRLGLATLTMETSSYIDSNSLATEVATISALLEEANRAAVGKKPPLADDPDALRRIRALAMHGSQLLAEVQRVHGDTALADAVHIQMVEAVPEAFFPLEFLYDGTPPLPDAEICPHASEALRDHDIHAKCPNADSDAYVCPAQFWGLKKYIERLPSKAPPAGNATSISVVPSRLGPFERALLGASQIAKAQMAEPDGLPSRVRRSVKFVEAASNWKDWKERVKKSPDLMILMAHTLDLPDVPNMAAMEISNNHLPSSSIRSPYVRGSQPPGPLVLLLGCSTVLTKVPFLNFARYFNLAGAPIVVGTLAMIHATQAAMIAERFLDFIGSRPVPRRFDAVLCEFKRELLSEGHQGALSLVSYGQASWEIGQGD